MTNYQVQRQHEKCARIIGLAIQAKTRACEFQAEMNKLRTSHTSLASNGESIWTYQQKFRIWMSAYERLKRYYHKQLQLLVGDEFVNINSLATI